VHLPWVAADVRCTAFPTYMEEAPLFPERTAVGLDVHARSVLAHGVDQMTAACARRGSCRTRGR